MKKVIIGAIVVCAIAGGAYGISRIQLSNVWLDGVKEPVKRGNLTIPVTANGTVEPEQYILIKSKAGGQVKTIHVKAGQVVKAGDILVELDPVDEQRNVEARQSEVDLRQSALEKSKIQLATLQKLLPLQVRSAQARLLDAKAQLDNAAFQLRRVKGLPKEVLTESELVSAQSNFDRAQAAVETAQVEVEKAKNDEKDQIDSVNQDITQGEAALRQAKKNLDEVKQRLSETVIRAPADGMVYRVDIKGGEMIQSGTQSFTGGTPLMMLADTSAMFVMAQVDEADIGLIRDIAPDFAKPGKTRQLSLQEMKAYAEHVLKSEKKGAALAEVGKTIGAGEELRGKPVEVTVDAYRNETYMGVIEQILPEPQNLANVITFRVRIRLVGDDLEKLLALNADLSFTTRSLENVVLVKNDALTSEGKQCFVYMPKKVNNRWDEEKREVRIGSTDGTFTEVLSGLKDTDEVWTTRPKLTEKEREAKGKA